MLRPKNGNEIRPPTVARALRVERQETDVRLDRRDTGLAAVTRSSAAEWTQSAGACVTPLILQSWFQSWFQSWLLTFLARGSLGSAFSPALRSVAMESGAQK